MVRLTSKLRTTEFELPASSPPPSSRIRSSLTTVALSGSTRFFSVTVRSKSSSVETRTTALSGPTTSRSIDCPCFMSCSSTDRCMSICVEVICTFSSAALGSDSMFPSWSITFTWEGLSFSTAPATSWVTPCTCACDNDPPVRLRTTEALASTCWASNGSSSGSTRCTRAPSTCPMLETVWASSPSSARLLLSFCIKSVIPSVPWSNSSYPVCPSSMVPSELNWRRSSCMEARGTYTAEPWLRSS